MYKLLTLLILLPSMSMAQQNKQLNWPQTFSGQPDFVFKKDETVKEALQKAKDEGAEAPTFNTWDDLLIAHPPQNPLNPQADPRAEENPAAEVDLNLLNAIAPTQQNVLPTVSEDALLDVSEFKQVLETAAKTAISKARIDLKKYNFQPNLARLTLQAVVTSPNQYAIINGRRYKVGDRLHVTVPVQVNAADILAAMAQHMPPKSAVPQERYTQYQQAQKDVLAVFESKKDQITRTQRIPITIKAIQSRKVILSTGKKEYVLEIKYRL